MNATENKEPTSNKSEMQEEDFAKYVDEAK